MKRVLPLLAWIVSGLLVALALIPAMFAWGDHDEHAALHVGDRVPLATFLDQRGQRLNFERFRGRPAIFGFVCTTCSLAVRCEGVSDAFAYLQQHLPRDIALVEVTFDPEHDSPKTLRAYGRRFGADPDRWTFAGAGANNAIDLIRFASAFGARDEPVGSASAKHAERLTLIDARGRIVEQSDVDGNWDATAFVRDALIVDRAETGKLDRIALDVRAFGDASPNVHALLAVVPAALFCLVLIVRFWRLGNATAAT